MQFFPDYSVSALGGVSLISDSASGYHTANPGNAFLDSLNEELAGTGISPVVDSSVSASVPTGFRQINNDPSSKLNNEDVSLIAEKLRKRGVNDSALEGLESLIASSAPLTIGNIMAAINGRARTTEELSDAELRDLETALQKLRFSPDEADEIMGFMANGQGPEALRMINARIAELGKESLGLSKGEVMAVLRGLDVSSDAMRKAEAFFAEDELAQAGIDALTDLLSPAGAEFAKKKAEQEKIAANIQSVMDELLREKKIRERTELVADTRGNRVTDRAERRMRDDMTAKGNGLGPMTEEELRRIEEKEAALADEQSAWEQRNNPHRETLTGGRNTVPARDAGAEAGADTTASHARQGFSSVLNRVDMAPGMTVPAQNQASAAPQQTAANAFSHRQEIFSQVEQGMLRQLSDGSRQMTLRLDPAELGQITLVLSVKAGEVRALIRAENPETTAALADQMNQLRSTLEEQGLKVAQLDVETRLPQDTTKDQWADLSQFNQEQELREQARFLRLAKLRRESGDTLAQDMQSSGMREENSAAGLHIIA